MEDAFVRLHEAPDIFRAVIDRITAFFLKSNQILYQALGNQLHAVPVGEYAHVHGWKKEMDRSVPDVYRLKALELLEKTK